MQRNGTRADSELWLAGRQPSATARLRLFCFPYAGAGASIYRSWVGRLGPDVDVCPVQLPGRETRMHERPFTKVGPLVDALTEGLSPLLDLPFALFGHSMGALIGFELARKLRDGGGPQPSHLFVSARRAPHLPDRFPSLCGLPDDRFVAMVKQRYDGIPHAVLECDDLLALLLPRLRADIELLDTCTYEPQPPLACPISVFGGSEDSTVDIAELEAWKPHTTARELRLRLLVGGHLFLQEQRDALLSAVSEDLRPHRGAVVPEVVV